MNLSEKGIECSHWIWTHVLFAVNTSHRANTSLNIHTFSIIPDMALYISYNGDGDADRSCSLRAPFSSHTNSRSSVNCRTEVSLGSLDVA